MRKFILLFLVSILLAGCFFPRDSFHDELDFIVQNNCTYPVSSFYEWEDLSRFDQYVEPNSIAPYTRTDRRKPSEAYEDGIKRILDKAEDKIGIIYPDGHEEIFTLKEFAEKADTQMEKRAYLAGL